MQNELLSYQEVLFNTEDGLRYLLLGNGFSINYDHKKFSFHNLFDCVKNSGIIENNSSIMRHFEELNIYDFEEVLKYLENALLIIGNYNTTELTVEIKNDIESLKKYLIKSITEIHPSSSIEVSSSEYRNCMKFLEKFSVIFTLNYDLLLNWVIQEYRNNTCKLGNRLYIDDGFRMSNSSLVFSDYNKLPEDDMKQTIFYLHGALHLFDNSVDIVKLSYNHNSRLLEQSKRMINDSNYPIFISEGNAINKLKKIKNNKYLTKSYEKLIMPPVSFDNIKKYGLLCKNKNLIIYGSLLEKDEHIINAILKGPYQNVYIGVRSKNKLYETACLNLISKFKLYNRNIYFYDFTTAKVWRE